MLAVSGGYCLMEVVPHWFPWTRTVRERIPQAIGTGEVGGAPPTSEIDQIAPSLALTDLAIECDCHLASSA